MLEGLKQSCKVRWMRKLALLVLFIVALALAGCAEKVEEVEKAISKEKAGISISSPKDAMKSIPHVVDFVWLDVERMKKDEMLRERISALSPMNFGDFASYISPEISVDTVEYVVGGDVIVNKYDLTAWFNIIRGNFDYEVIRDDLKAKGYQPRNYMGIETYSKGHYSPEKWNSEIWVSIIDKNCIIYGGRTGVQEVIKVLKGEKVSEYDYVFKNETKRVIERLSEESPRAYYVAYRGLTAYLRAHGAYGEALSEEKIDNKLKRTLMIFGDENLAKKWAEEKKKSYPDLKIKVEDRMVIAIDEWNPRERYPHI